MARAHVAIVAGVCMFLSLVFHLLSVYYSWQPSFPSLIDFHKAGRPTSSPKGSTALDEYLLGVGKADITGPVVELNFMGYASPDQTGTGLRQRLYSRAFIIGDVDDPSTRFAYLVLDIQSGDTAIRQGVLDGLASLGPGYAMYGQNNIALIGTHSHSGPAAWLNYLLPQITSKGFNKQSYQAIVDGAVLSIKRAHDSLSPGSLTFGSINITDANISRSPYAYLANPEQERKRYPYDVDKTLTLLRFERASDHKKIGVLTWFPVHGTSMLNNNTLVTGDNKGVAAYLFEKSVVGADDAAEDFVAGFSQSNVGDTSPNVLGAWCEDGSNEQCSFKNSTCGGRNEPCHGRGPFFREKDEGTKSCFEIGRRQYNGAKELYDSLDDTGIPIQGSVASLHTFKDFSHFSFTLPNGTVVKTCPAALGYSFAAGTTDGPGAFDFKQNNPGAPDANPLWSVVRGLLREPSPEQMKCHAPKPILLDVGEISKPYDWTPNIVDIQLLKVGQLVMIVSPGEATTMSGRRWKEIIKRSADALSRSESIVVLGGPANSYTHYIATEEEYGIQRYEGASTLYGPHTLNAYINASVEALPYLYSKGAGNLDPGPPPPNNVNRSLNFITGVVYDSAPIFKRFGDVTSDVEGSSFRKGSTVEAKFVAANPRNNLNLEKTYAEVEKLSSDDGTFSTARTDADWSLIFRWERTSEVLGTSEVTIQWEIEDDSEGKAYMFASPAPLIRFKAKYFITSFAQFANLVLDFILAGIYRLHYYGESKAAVTGKHSAFEGLSSRFTVTG
ncbi:MAG: hypothetical protein M1837_006118 [Sclerophora amabilis]|nr:MAG: hypothetical protein M1837_006118 [Sclerophora amabilis]